MARYDFFKLKKISFLGKYMHDVYQSRVLSFFTFLSTTDKKQVKTVLEVGVGQGKTAFKLIELGFQYIGYEPSNLLREALAEKNLKVHPEMVPPLKEKDNTVDAVLLSHLFEHMKDLDQALYLLEEVHRVLRPNGRILIVAPDYTDFLGWFYECDYTHQFPVSLYKVKYMLLDCGLKPLKLKYIWGSFRWFPGSFLNYLIKITFWLIQPIFDLFYPKWHKLLKLRCMFSRSIWIEAKK